MKQFFARSNFRLAVEVLLILVLVFLAWPQSLMPAVASPQAPEAPEALNWYVCNPPNHVAIFMDRVHVYCQTTSVVLGGTPALSTNIVWFAVPTAPDSAAASRFMSLLQTAVITGKPVWIQLDPNDTSGSSFGCGAANCRRIYGMEMR